MELQRPATRQEINRAIRGDLDPEEFLDPTVEVSFSQKSVWDWLKKDRMNGIIQKRWRVIPKVYTGTDEPEPYSLKNGPETMISEAKRKNKRLTANYQGVPFIVSPQINDTDEMMRSVEVAWYAHHFRVQEEMEKENLDVTGHTSAWDGRKKEDADIAAIAERLGKRLQAEMKLAKAEKLTSEIVSRATDFEEKYNNEKHFVQAGKMLFECWKYGAEFADIVGFPKNQLEELREKSKDKVFLKQTLRKATGKGENRKRSTPDRL